jgi:hypothetical protein
MDYASGSTNSRAWRCSAFCKLSVALSDLTSSCARSALDVCSRYQLYEIILFGAPAASLGATEFGVVQNDRNVAQYRLARLIASDRVPTKMRLKAQVASRLNQLRDTNLRPK